MNKFATITLIGLSKAYKTIIMVINQLVYANCYNLVFLNGRFCLQSLLWRMFYGMSRKYRCTLAWFFLSPTLSSMVFGPNIIEEWKNLLLFLLIHKRELDFDNVIYEFKLAKGSSSFASLIYYLMYHFIWTIKPTETNKKTYIFFPLVLVFPTTVFFSKRNRDLNFNLYSIN
ncbi:hypothetical protein BpHYR1_021131 [Brachionus plicatilis]|uniref:Uncharacterized protein n=1 Tax=Brachionus plicatilis TaxID=10195 RepID=A0A3M7QXF7_BRAPC|nr:hypothetical protein BpHYR1_021131 [Brachionus plicatilis]